VITRSERCQPPQIAAIRTAATTQEKLGKRVMTCRRAALDALPILQHLYNITNFPKLVSHASSHRGGNPQRLMDTAKIVIHVVQGNRKSVVLDLL
jgi:hypothetical protein